MVSASAPAPLVDVLELTRRFGELVPVEHASVTVAMGLQDFADRLVGHSGGCITGLDAGRRRIGLGVLFDFGILLGIAIVLVATGAQMYAGMGY